MRPLLFVALGAALASCKPASAEPPPPVRFEHDVMVRFHMHENFDLLRAVERLLVRGKLDEAQHLAAGIAQAPDEPGMSTFAAQATRVRERAAAVASAPGVEEALRREARLAGACAGCHNDAAILPEFRSWPTAPADKPTVEARMARHLWATDRMWEGIVGGVDEPWRAGLDVLASTPLPFSALQGDRPLLARQLQQLADTARKRGKTDGIDDRVRAYGEMLVTCAACHTTKAGP
jgi:hypothetical protein